MQKLAGIWVDSKQAFLAVFEYGLIVEFIDKVADNTHAAIDGIDILVMHTPPVVDMQVSDNRLS